MGIFDSLMRKETPSLFPEGQPLSSRSWTGNEFITDALKANVKDVMTVQLSDEKLKKIEEESRKLKPALKVYTYNKYLCYLSKDEHRVYNLVQMIEKEVELEEIETPSIQVQTKGLDGLIRSAKKENSNTPDYPKKPEFIEKSTSDFPPSELENQWAEAKLIEELRALESEIQESEQEIQDAKALLNEADKGTIPDETRPQKKRKTLGRTNQIKVRLTDIELAKFHQRVEKSGLSQGEFIRNAILNEQIVIEERSAIDVAALDELALLRAEIGRQGGLLKMITKPNIGMRTFRPDEWEELMNAIRDLDKMKEKVSKLEMKFNGNSKTSSK